MGNFTSGSGNESFKILQPVRKRFPYFPNALRQHLRESDPSRSVGRSMSSFRRVNVQVSSTPSSSRTHSFFRISKKKQKKDLNCSKTTWPVPNFESIFLPEFKIKDGILENLFHITGTISSGAFGNVFKVVKYDTNEVYAMKVLSKAQLVASDSINQVKEEVKIQQLVGHHPFIVNCTFYWQGRKQLYIISEYVSGGELSKLLQDKGSLPQEVIKLYTAELAITLDFLHNAGIIYRDLKLENILLDSRGHIQLIDFGLSKRLKFGSRTNTICGTLQYIAPEILQKKPYGHAVDWWSLGIVVVSMINGQCPYASSVDEDGRVRPTPELGGGGDGGEEIRDLVDRLLAPDPSTRLRSLPAIKRTAFFHRFDFDRVLDFSVDLDSLTVKREA